MPQDTRRLSTPKRARGEQKTSGRRRRKGGNEEETNALF